MAYMILHVVSTWKLYTVQAHKVPKICFLKNKKGGPENVRLQINIKKGGGGSNMILTFRYTPIP